MNKIDLKKVDLNLLLVFEVLMQERSVTLAAHTLGRTQSAISHALARLRAQVGDPLLVKQGGVMQPSPFALQLAEEVRPILRNIERVLTPAEAFDAPTSTRRFAVGLPDFAPSLFPRIAKDFLHQAPHAVLEWQSIGYKILEKVLEGQINVCIAPAHLRQPEGVSSLGVGELEWGCYVRKNHPALNGQWNIEAWQRYGHIAVRVGDTPYSPVDEQSAGKGLTRRVAVWVPKFSAIAPLLAQTDLIATMPKILMQDSLYAYGLVALPVPYPQNPMAQCLYWPSRYDNDGANRWIRQMVQTEFEAITQLSHSTDNVQRNYGSYTDEPHH